MAKTLSELWNILNAGKSITNGDMKVWYEDGLIYSEPDVENPLVFQNTETLEDWYEYVEPVEEDEATVEQQYCRWYVVRADGSFKIDNYTWYLIEKEPPENHFRMNESYATEDIVGEQNET